MFVVVSYLVQTIQRSTLYILWHCYRIAPDIVLFLHGLQHLPYCSTLSLFSSPTTLLSLRYYPRRKKVSIVAGMTAGVAGAIVSQPADTVLTRLNTLKKPALPTGKLTPKIGRPWDLRPSVAGAVGAGTGVSNGNGVFDMPSQGGLGVGLLEKEGGGEEEDEEKLQAPDWKEVVRDLFEGDEGVSALFR